MNTKIKISQYIRSIKLRKFDTADIKCFTVIYTSLMIRQP